MQGNVSPRGKLHALAQRAVRSLAFRSGPVCRRLLALLPPPAAGAKPRLEVPLLTMCGGKHLAMLTEMLWSVARCWSQLPEVLIVSDGTLEPADITRRLAWWPGKMKVTHWKGDQEYHRRLGRTALVEYAEKNPFGRKLSTILAASERERTFWCDCDLLFYADLAPQLVSRAERAPFILASEDWTRAYDERLFEYGLVYLKELPAVNSGVCLFEGNLYDGCALEPLIREVSTNGNWFTEQTIIAHAVYQTGQIKWTRDIVRVFDEDQFGLLPTYLGQSWVARHYTNHIRHLFWRDALALRLGIGRTA